MLNNPLARTSAQPDIVETDYQAFCAALSASLRGRAFLAEYARRNRHADTEMVLAALDRLQAQVRGQIAAPQADRIRQELRALLAAIRTTRPEIDDSPTAIRAAKQAALLGFVEHRIGALVAPEREASVVQEEVAALISPERAAAAARSLLAVVPVPEQPELPIPAPASVAAAPIALVRPAPAIPEVVFAASAPAKPPKPEPVAVAKPVAPEPAVPVAPPVASAAVKADADPLAAIMALTEAERIALFT
jgi:hypothetical protein